VSAARVQPPHHRSRRWRTPKCVSSVAEGEREGGPPRQQGQRQKPPVRVPLGLRMCCRLRPSLPVLIGNWSVLLCLWCFLSSAVFPGVGGQAGTGERISGGVRPPCTSLSQPRMEGCAKSRERSPEQAHLPEMGILSPRTIVTTWPTASDVRTVLRIGWGEDNQLPTISVAVLRNPLSGQPLRVRGKRSWPNSPTRRPRRRTSRGSR
jgi:hypothetical protein